MYWLIDFLIVGTVLGCAIIGWRRGLIMAVFGALTIIVALAGAWVLSGIFSGPVEAAINRPISNFVEGRFDRMDASFATANTSYRLGELGLNHHIIGRITDRVDEQLTQAGYTFQNAVASSLVSVIARVITFAIAFVILVVVLRFAAKLLDSLSKLPILNMVNKLGGLGGGLLQGVLIVWLSVTVLLFIGLINAETVESSFWLSRFW